MFWLERWILFHLKATFISNEYQLHVLMDPNPHLPCLKCSSLSSVLPTSSMREQPIVAAFCQLLFKIRNVSGFCIMKDVLDDPPNDVTRGYQKHIESSKLLWTQIDRGLLVILTNDNLRVMINVKFRVPTKIYSWHNTRSYQNSGSIKEYITLGE